MAGGVQNGSVTVYLVSDSGVYDYVFWGKNSLDTKTLKVTVVIVARTEQGDRKAVLRCNRDPRG